MDWKKRAEELADNFVRDNIAKENAVTSEEKAWAHIFEKVTYGSFEEGFSAGRQDVLVELAPVFETLSLIDINFSKITKCDDPQCVGCLIDAKIAAEEAGKALAVLKEIRGE